MINDNHVIELIKNKTKIVALTGAGVSVLSGIPDYRTVKGVYQGQERPEYLLSRTCLENEPDLFYSFVKKLYHLDAKPNIIHEKLGEITRLGGIITQNIDQLHKVTGTEHLVEFHGSLHRCYCLSCGSRVAASDYLNSDRHANCGGQVRPDIVLYEEGLSEDVLKESERLMSLADLVLIVGTSFQVYPFCQLIQFKQPDVPVIVINDQSIELTVPHEFMQMKAEAFFNIL